MIIREYTIIKNDVNHPALEEVKCYEWEGESIPLDENYRMLNEVFKMNKLSMETSYVLAFDHTQELKGVCEIGKGNANEVETSMSNIFTFLLLTGANSFFVAHNHVSNMPEPSHEDEIASMRMNMLANMFDIEFIGHMVISPFTYVVNGGIMDGTTGNDFSLEG